METIRAHPPSHFNTVNAVETRRRPFDVLPSLWRTVRHWRSLMSTVTPHNSRAIVDGAVRAAQRLSANRCRPHNWYSQAAIACKHNKKKTNKTSARRWRLITNYHQSSSWWTPPCRSESVGVDCDDYFGYFSPTSFGVDRAAATVGR